MPGETEAGIGRITISEEVIATLAARAALNCPGVAGMTAGRFKDGLAHIAGREQLGRGAEVRLVEGHLLINLNIIVSYGVKIAEVAGRVMEEVQSVVEETTGLPVDELNVHVQGVRLTGETV